MSNKTKPKLKKIDEFKEEYDEKNHLYSKLCYELSTQIEALLTYNKIQTAFSIESRVKTWESVCNKCERIKFEPKGLSDIKDIAGLRLILLFQRDLNKTRYIIEKNFTIHEVEDTSQRLRPDQFGYGSVHYILSPPNDWCSVPTLKHLKGLIAEVQIRTASQHIWATSSHLLQYKKESDVPLPVRRSINRVAALLEIVDLEFERVLDNRDQYIKEIETIDEKSQLNTDLFRKILDEELPPENKDEPESYAELLDDYRYFGINTIKQLKEILTKHKDKIIKEDRKMVKEKSEYLKKKGKLIGTTKERLQKNVFFTHIGLARVSLQEEVGMEKYLEYDQSIKKKDKSTKEES